MKRLILSLTISVMVLAANLASGQDVKAIYGRLESISDKIVTVNNTIIALPEKVSVYRTDGSPISLGSLKTGDYVAVTLPSKTEVVIKMVTRQEADRHMPLDVR
jgi:3-dehydroquinate synthase class II